MIVRELEGTELFNLLENSFEGASRKIAELLDGTLSSETEAGSSTLRKNDFRTEITLNYVLTSLSISSSLASLTPVNHRKPLYGCDALNGTIHEQLHTQYYL